MSLTEKQRRFVEAYVLKPNAKRAAIAAGYSAATAEVQGSRLLRHAEVARSIDQHRRLLSMRTGITPEMVLMELAKVGFSDIRKLVSWSGAELADEHDGRDGEGGEPCVVIRAANFVKLIDSDRIDEETAGAIAEISQAKDGALKVKLHNKLDALTKIGQHLGMFKADSKGTGKDEGTSERPLSRGRGDSWDTLLN